MEKHFLNEYVTGEPEFRPEPWYNPHGDCIIYQTADEAVVRERVDEFLTVYHSALDNRVIGYQIKDVTAIIKKFGLVGLAVQSEQNGTRITSISASALLLAAYEDGLPSLRRREAYAEAISGPACTIPVSQIC
ncbi:MAG TPA: hypothetical protein ENN87_11000 [Phycisphaerales bacterium]|nr:hypothetical protein [Phycisphaerales bacterium]